jgi:hypothetical protein
VVACLSIKCEALSSNPGTGRKGKKEGRKGGREGRRKKE